MGVMAKEFDGFVAAGAFAEATEIPEGCNIVDARLLYCLLYTSDAADE